MLEMSNLNPREIMAAAGHAVALRLGASVSNPHPLSAELSLRDIAFAAGSLARVPQRHEDDRQVIARGLITADFSRVLADGTRHLITRAYSAQAQHVKFCSELEALDFRPMNLPGLDIDARVLPLADGAEIQRCYARVASGAEQVMLTIFARALSISRELIINDSFEMIGSIVSAMGASAARTEAKMVADTLAGNQLLDDGNPTFHADYGNIEASVFSTAALGAAMAKMRVQSGPSGEFADLAAAHLVVAADLEYQAQRDVFESGLPIEVTAMAYLPAGRWFLLAEKDVQPSISILKLKGSKVPVRVEQRRLKIQEDGIGLQVAAELGATLLGRRGIIRGGV